MCMRTTTKRYAVRTVKVKVPYKDFLHSSASRSWWGKYLFPKAQLACTSRKWTGHYTWSLSVRLFGSCSLILIASTQNYLLILLNLFENKFYYIRKRILTVAELAKNFCYNVGHD